MQSLGKVPSARRAPQPVNLPSLKSESGVTTPEAPSSTSSTSTSIATTASGPATTPSSSTLPNQAGWTGSGQDAPATKPSQSPAPAAPPAPSQPAPYLDRKFQQEFPSLDAQPTSGPPKRAQQPPAQPAGPASASEVPRQESPQPLQYGPGPSLRPQTEGSWVQGGRPSHGPSQNGPGMFLAFLLEN